MKILIVSATSLEIDPLIKQLGAGESLLQSLVRYRYGGLQVDILITGVGMVSTTYWLTKVLSKYKYDAAINAGICGSFSQFLSLGDVVNVTTDSFPEVGAESGEYFLSLVDLKLLELDEFPFRDGKLVNDFIFKGEVIEKLPTVSGVTVNTVHGNHESIDKFRVRFPADVESMEGASFFYCCLRENIRCIQIRAVSNFIEPRDMTKWDIPASIHNLNNVLLSLLQD